MILAILTADWHVSETAPIWRSNELNWPRAMGRAIDQVLNIATKAHNCPVLIAGDLFHKPDVPPQVINWLLGHLPKRVIAIPGQHDLFNHNLELLEYSAFHTLNLAERIFSLANPSANSLYKTGIASILLSTDRTKTRVRVHGFPFGRKLEVVHPKYREYCYNIALCHSYIWKDSTNIPRQLAGEVKDTFNNVPLINNKVYGFDVIVYGDNHAAFEHQVRATTIFNCGSLMRRNKDQKEHQPRVGLLMYNEDESPSFSIESYPLNIAGEHCLPTDEEKQEEIGERPAITDFRQLGVELSKLQKDTKDLKLMIRRFCRANNIPNEVYDMIIATLAD